MRAQHQTRNQLQIRSRPCFAPRKSSAGLLGALSLAHENRASGCESRGQLSSPLRSRIPGSGSPKNKRNYDKRIEIVRSPRVTRLNAEPLRDVRWPRLNSRARHANSPP
jgi:hypothetical protein